MTINFLSAPIIWIGLPGFAGLVFWFMRHNQGWVIILSTLSCLGLAALAWVVPIGRLFHIGPLALTINSTLEFAGRRLVLTSGDQTFLVFIFLLCAFWFAGSYAAGANPLLVSFGLGMLALLVSAHAVEPFLYAALLVEMAVLLAVPVLAPPGKLFGQGVLRFLIFQTLGMPFILLAGWALAGVEANPSDPTLVTLSVVFLALGFAFWLAIFPFYTWIPLLAEQSFPYVTGFVLTLLVTVNLLLGLNFLNTFGWLRASPELFVVLRRIGTLMIVTAGVWSAFQKDLARLFGYAVIVETGFSLLAISLGNHTGDILFASMLLPRLIGNGLWALSLSVLLHKARSTSFQDVQGLAGRMPYATAGLAVASLTLGGLPLLAAFPIREVLLEEISRLSLIDAGWALVGMVGMLFSTFRALAVLGRGAFPAPSSEMVPPLSVAPPFSPAPTARLQSAVNEPVTGPRSRLLPPATPTQADKIPLPQAYSETRMQIALLAGGILSLLVIGLFPQVFTPILNGLLASFPQLP